MATFMIYVASSNGKIFQKLIFLLVSSNNFSSIPSNWQCSLPPLNVESEGENSLFENRLHFELINGDDRKI